MAGAEGQSPERRETTPGALSIAPAHLHPAVWKVPPSTVPKRAGRKGATVAASMVGYEALAPEHAPRKVLESFPGQKLDVSDEEVPAKPVAVPKLANVTVERPLDAPASPEATENEDMVMTTCVAFARASNVGWLHDANGVAEYVNAAVVAGANVSDADAALASDKRTRDFIL